MSAAAMKYVPGGIDRGWWPGRDVSVPLPWLVAGILNSTACRSNQIPRGKLWPLCYRWALELRWTLSPVAIKVCTGQPNPGKCQLSMHPF